MLNEVKEFEQYSFDTKLNEEKKNHRLNYRSLCKNTDFSGIERAMTIVARKYMFESGKRDIDSARKMLEAWCGTANTPDDIKKKPIYNWLYKYIRDCLLEEKIKDLKGFAHVSQRIMKLIEEIKPEKDDKELLDIAERLQTEKSSQEREQDFNNHVSPVISCIKTLNKLPDKRKQFGKKLFYVPKPDKDHNNHNKGRKNDYKVIVYDKILAAAADAGPLRTYYLLLDSPDFMKTLESRERNTDVRKDRFLKTVAAYLLLQKSPEQKYVAINITDNINWLGCKESDYAKTREELTYNGQKVFDEIKVSTNQKKLKTNEEVLKHFKLVAEPDMEKEWNAFSKDNPGAVFYDDQGANVSMKMRSEFKRKDGK